MYPVVKSSAGGVSGKCTFTEILLLADGILMTVGEDPVPIGVSVKVKVLKILLNKTTHNQNAQHIDGKTFSAGINCYTVAYFNTVAVISPSVRIFTIQMLLSLLVKVMCECVWDAQKDILTHLISAAMKDACTLSGSGNSSDSWRGQAGVWGTKLIQSRYLVKTNNLFV